MHKIASRFFKRSNLRPALILILVFAIIFLLFFWRLGNLTPAYSLIEKNSLSQSASLSAVVANPSFAPHKMFQFGSGFLGDSGLWARLPSVIVALVFLVSFYVVSRRWFGKLVAVLSTLMFASLPWIILTSRSAAPEIMYLSSLALIAGIVWLSMTDRKKTALFVTSLAAIMVAYTPGLVFFLIVALYLWRRKIIDASREVGRIAWIGAFFLLLIGILPLVWAAIQHPGTLRSIILIPTEIPPPLDILKTVVWGALSFVWSTREGYPLILGRLPLLSVSVTALSVFGFYIMWKRAKSELVAMLILLLTAILGYGLNRDMAVLTIAFPAFGILMAAGLRFLYAEWRSIFPLNPIPKSLAIFLVVGLVALNMMYGIRYALAAWPNNQTTKSIYVLK